MYSEHYKNNRHRKRGGHFLALLICILLFLILFFSLLLVLMHALAPVRTPSENEAVTEEAAWQELPTESVTEAQTEEARQADFSDLKETDIYTFLQGPKAWASKADWSGKWHEVVLADQEFSVFGCGLCDLANIYSTLTPYDCSPLDMYYFAQEASGYAPVSGFGAIDWPYLKQTLKAVGISSLIKRKDKKYEQFQKNIASSVSAIVLVCSYDDDTYWHDVEGHYVNIWLYNSEDDTVFLADSGNPDHNRQRIPLRYIYDALKTSSNYQYLLITGADEEKNTWKHDGIEIKWRKPKYYKK